MRTAMLRTFSALQRAENSSIRPVVVVRAVSWTLSVLFSEPKIPQSAARHRRTLRCRPFSALQRAENSSIRRDGCRCGDRRPFSALQRAENSSIDAAASPDEPRPPFQCSSASRKFLNALRCARRRTRHGLSVLFSEPKIPQYFFNNFVGAYAADFQCSSASRKFLNAERDAEPRALDDFQCSSASRKFLNPIAQSCSTGSFYLSVLFSEPKIPQSSRRTRCWRRSTTAFSALQRAENSSIAHQRCEPPLVHPFQCSSASRKFLNAHQTRGQPAHRPFQCSSASRKFLNQRK